MCDVIEVTFIKPYCIWNFMTANRVVSCLSFCLWWSLFWDFWGQNVIACAKECCNIVEQGRVVLYVTIELTKKIQPFTYFNKNVQLFDSYEEFFILLFQKVRFYQKKICKMWHICGYFWTILYLDFLQFQMEL